MYTLHVSFGAMQALTDRQQHSRSDSANISQAVVPDLCTLPPLPAINNHCPISTTTAQLTCPHMQVLSKMWCMPSPRCIPHTRMTDSTALIATTLTSIVTAKQYTAAA
jgi:hypothetical protein